MNLVPANRQHHFLKFKNHSSFEAAYEETLRDADFNDLYYDAVFRAIAQLGVLNGRKALFDLEQKLLDNPRIVSLVEDGKLIYSLLRLIRRRMTVTRLMRDGHSIFYCGKMGLLLGST